MKLAAFEVHLDEAHTLPAIGEKAVKCGNRHFDYIDAARKIVWQVAALLQSAVADAVSHHGKAGAASGGADSGSLDINVWKAPLREPSREIRNGLNHDHSAEPTDKLAHGKGMESAIRPAIDGEIAWLEDVRIDRVDDVLENSPANSLAPAQDSWGHPPRVGFFPSQA